MTNPIIRKGYHLVTEKGNKPVSVGDKVVDFRGEETVVQDATPPAHEGSTGRVYVGWDDSSQQGYYPSVFNLKWIKGA